MVDPSKFDPASLKPSLVTDEGKLKPSLVKSNYVSGAGSADTLKSSLLNRDGDLTEALTRANGLKPSLVRFFNLDPSAPVNTSAPTISGFSNVGQVLMANVGGWSGFPSPSYAYQWYKDNVVISGATASTYTPVVADENADIKVRVTATNSEGSAFADSSAVTIGPAFSAPVNTVAPVISGDTTIGENLTCTPGTWSANPSPAYSYHWRRNGVPITSATNSNYETTVADDGQEITCLVTAVNSQGAVDAVSNALTAGTPVLPSEGLRSSLLVSTAPTLAGVIADERPNLGTDRPRLPGRCIDLNNCSANLGVLDLTGAFTVSMWLRPVDTSTVRGFFTLAPTFHQGLIFRTGTNFEIWGSATHNTGVAPILNQYQHVVISYNSAESNRLRFYRAGALLWTGSGAIPNLNGSCWLGRNYTGSAANLGNARHSDVRIWKQELTPTQIEQLYLLQEDANLPATYRHYKCDSQHPTLLLDSSGNDIPGTLNSHTAAVGAAFYEGDDVPVDWLNRKGYSDGTGATKLPRDESDTAKDIEGNPLDYTGEAPNPAQAVQANCATFSGSQFLTVPSLVGTETVVRSGGTATPTVSAGRIDFTAGTCWDLELSNGMWFPLSEGSGNTHRDVIGDTVATINGHDESVYFGQTQDAFHYNLVYGFDKWVSQNGTSGSHVKFPITGKTANDTVQFDIITTDDKFVLLQGNASQFIGAAENTASTAVNANAGSPVFYVDGALVAVANRQDLFNALSDGQEHTIRIASCNLSGWLVAQMWYTGFELKALLRNFKIDFGSTGTWDHESELGDTDGFTRTGATEQVVPRISGSPSSALHNLAESKFDLNPANSPYKGAIAPASDWHPVDNPGSNPVFFRQRTSGGNVVAADRLVEYDRVMTGTELASIENYIAAEPI